MVKENVGWRIQGETKAYVRLAAARLGQTQEQIVEDAIRLHREYYTRTGLIEEASNG